MSAPPIVMFLSTGRCGTQWLTAGLRELYPDIEVEHEPIGPLYAPRRYFRRYDEPEAILQVAEVRAHVERIERWPTLARRVPDRLRIVHLTRHPIPTALSHLAHNSYAGSARDDAYTRLATLGPSDPNVFQPQYAELWAELTPYEKCLFWWTEVNLLGLELPERLERIPSLRVASERILRGERAELAPLLEFMQLDWNDCWLALAGRTVDRWHHHTDLYVHPEAIQRHPVSVETARALGYELDDVDIDAMRARYQGEPDPGLDRIGRFA
jgi:hypothetical protein